MKHVFQPMNCCDCHPWWYWGSLVLLGGVVLVIMRAFAWMLT